MSDKTLDAFVKSTKYISANIGLDDCSAKIYTRELCKNQSSAKIITPKIREYIVGKHENKNPRIFIPLMYLRVSGIHIIMLAMSQLYNPLDPAMDPRLFFTPPPPPPLYKNLFMYLPLKLIELSNVFAP